MTRKNPALQTRTLAAANCIFCDKDVPFGIHVLVHLGDRFVDGQ